MKKAVAVMAVVISTGAFAKGHMGSEVNRRNSLPGKQGRQIAGQLEALTPEQQAEFETLHRAHRDSMKMSSLEIKEISLQIQKEKLAENPDQAAMNRLIDKKAALKGDKEKEALAFRLEMKEKFGLDMRGDMGRKQKNRG